MELKYFSISDDKETIKAKYKKLALEWHPDRNIGKEAECTKKMQDINSEFQHCVKYGPSFAGESANSSNLDVMMTDLVRCIIDEMLRESSTSPSMVAFLTNIRKEMGEKPLLATDFLRILVNVGNIRKPHVKPVYVKTKKP